MCNGLDGSKRKPLDRTKGRVGTRRLDDWAEYRNLWVGDDEQARMLTLIRWQNSVGSACSNERFRWLGKKRRGSQTGVAKAGLGSDASSRAMCCSKCLSWPKFIFWGSLIHTHTHLACAPLAGTSNPFVVRPLRTGTGYSRIRNVSLATGGVDLFLAISFVGNGCLTSVGRDVLPPGDHGCAWSKSVPRL